MSGGLTSFARLAWDVVLYRALHFGALPGEDGVRSIRLQGGRHLAYRLNRGDIQGIREVLIDEVYTLPFVASPRVIVDLGANIGLTSLFFSHRYDPETLIAIEPDPRNAVLARRNLAGVRGVVIEAAISSKDGTGWFGSSRDSNLGSLRTTGEGRDVRLLSMQAVLDSIPGGRIDLLKIDIEGGEQELLTSETEWLSSVGAIIAEFHPDRVDYPGLVRVLVDNGFRYIPAGSAWSGSMDAFVRDGA